jgi:phage repressor protein C with HTH and peptisase S24 domain
MFSHEAGWQAIDLLAHQHGLSPSGRARKAGMDATSLNRSKRVAPDGRERWPSTETLSKLLACVEVDLLAFAQLMRSLPDQTRLPSEDCETLDHEEPRHAA